MLFISLRTWVVVHCSLLWSKWVLQKRKLSCNFLLKKWFSLCSIQTEKKSVLKTCNDNNVQHRKWSSRREMSHVPLRSPVHCCFLTLNSWTWTDPNKAVVTLQPNWSEIYRGETITLRCEIKDGGDTEWEYEWRTTSSEKPPNQNEHRIRFASASHSGDYRCKGRNKHTQHSSTDWSDPIKLTVSHSKSHHFSFKVKIKQLKICFFFHISFLSKSSVCTDCAECIWSTIKTCFHSEKSFSNRTPPHCVSIMAECCSLSNSDLQCYRSVCRMEVLLVPDCSCSIKHLLQLWAATWQQQWDWTGFLHCSWTDTHSRICVQSWKRRSSVLHWLQSTSVCLVCRSVCFCLLRNRCYISSVHLFSK